MHTKRFLSIIAAFALAAACSAPALAEETGYADDPEIPIVEIEEAGEDESDEAGVEQGGDEPGAVALDDVGEPEAEDELVEEPIDEIEDGPESIDESEPEPALEPEPEPVSEPVDGSEPEPVFELDVAAAPEPAAEPEPAPEPAPEPVPEPAPEPAPAPRLATQALEPQEPAYTGLDARAYAAKNLIRDDRYYIRSRMGSKQVLDVAEQSTQEGGNVIVWVWNGGGNQQWDLTHDEIGYVSLRSVLSGLMLTMDGKKSGSNIEQQAELTGAQAKSQKWIIEKAEGGGYVIISALSPSLVIDLTGCTSANNTNVEVWTDNGGKNQAFDFIDATPEVAPSTASIASGYYTIRSQASANVLDISGESMANGGNAIGWSPTGNTNQLFKVTKVGGYYRIETVMSSKAIEVADGCPIPGANIDQRATARSNANSLFSIAQNPNGTYTFTNVASGLTMTMDASEGASVHGARANGKDTQQFALVRKVNLLSEGIYEITPATNSKMRLDVNGQSRASGANVIIWTSNGGQNQKWEILRVSGKDNTYTIQSINSGAYLCATGSEAGANVNQRKVAAANASAQWVPDYAGGRLTFRNVETGMMLDVTGCGSKAGTNVETWTANSTSAQRFTLTKTPPLGNGYYSINFTVGGQVLDISGKSTKSGGNAISYKSNGGGNQKWFIQRQSDGTYKIVNAYSELPLAVSGTNVQQAAPSSSASQRWKITYNHDGTFNLVSAANTSVVLSIAGGTPRNSANANVQAEADNAGQCVYFAPTTYSGGTLGLSGVKLDMYKRAQGYSSPTSWLILVDNDTCWVGVFRRYDGRWNYDRYFRCSNGAYSTPTVRGVYYTGAKGYTFGSESGFACYWYTQFYGDYLFHSTLYQPYSFDVLDSRLGMHLSHGCVRLHIDNAKYIYDKVPYDTKVVSYN